MTGDTKQWYVEFIGEGGKVEKRLGPFSSERQAERCERGANINLDHERFFTRIVLAKDKHR